MIVFNQDNLEQTITIIPRFEAEEVLILTLKDESTSEIVYTNTFVNTYLDGFIIVTGLEFDFLSEGKRFSVLIENERGEIVYRGKAISTNQDTQNYSISDDTFSYGQ